MEKACGPLTTASVVALQQASRTLPLVFVQVIDPVGSGLVASLARPGGNATGFTSFEYAISAKWLELLKEVAPRVTRVAVLRTSTAAAGIGQFAAVQTVAPVGSHIPVKSCKTARQLEGDQREAQKFIQDRQNVQLKGGS